MQGAKGSHKCGLKVCRSVVTVIATDLVTRTEVNGLVFNLEIARCFYFTEEAAPVICAVAIGAVIKLATFSMGAVLFYPALAD